MMTALTLVNGQFCDTLTVHDRGLAYGDGLFDTLLISNGQPVFYDLHIQRLLKGCERLGLSLKRETIETDIKKLLIHTEKSDSAVLKTIITRGSGQRGYRITENSVVNRVLIMSPLSSNEHTSGKPLTLALCDTRLGHNPALAGIKHLNRIENVLARNEWRSLNVDEGLMLDTSGNVIEGTMSNVFWCDGDVLYTPGLTRCGVEGVMRQVIIDRLASKLGLAVKQGDFRLDSLYQADEIIMSNSLMGIRSVGSIGCHQKNSDVIAAQLRQALEQYHA
jgi:4-amino-4-deoxychorismate lyase